MQQDLVFMNKIKELALGRIMSGRDMSRVRLPQSRPIFFFLVFHTSSYCLINLCRDFTLGPENCLLMLTTFSKKCSICLLNKDVWTKHTIGFLLTKISLQLNPIAVLPPLTTERSFLAQRVNVDLLVTRCERAALSKSSMCAIVPACTFIRISSIQIF